MYKHDRYRRRYVCYDDVRYHAVSSMTAVHGLGWFIYEKFSSSTW